MEPASFFAERWGRHATLIRGHATKFASLYDVSADRWIDHAAELEAATTDEAGRQQQFRITPEQVHGHFTNGMTICANVTGDPSLTPTLYRFAQELQLPGAPFAKIYASPNDHGFPLHLDSFHVFVCQLVGRKRWRYSPAPAVDAPIFSGKADPDLGAVWSQPREGEPITDDEGSPIPVPAPGDLEDCVLEPGDCLYLPPGCWHVAQAIGRSVALSISPPRTPIYQLITKTLEDHLTERAAFRRDVFAPYGNTAAVPDDVVSAFASRLADLRAVLDELDPRTLHRVWRINASAFDLTEPAGAPPLRADSHLRHAGHAVTAYLVAPLRPGGPDAIHFYAHGSEWTLPIEAEPFVRALAGRPRFTVAEAKTFVPDLSEADVRELLEQLLEAGLVDLIR